MSDIRVELVRAPAGWSPVVSHPVHLLVRLTPDDPLVQQCREVAGRGFDAVLDVLVRARGLSALPDFAAVDLSDGRVLARGAGCADVRGPGPSGLVRAGREPWRDAALVDSVQEVILYAESPAPEPSAGHEQLAAPADPTPPVDDPARTGRVAPVAEPQRLPERGGDGPGQDPGRTLDPADDPEAFELTAPPPVDARSWSHGQSLRVPAPQAQGDAGQGSPQQHGDQPQPPVAQPDVGQPGADDGPRLIDAVPWRKGQDSSWWTPAPAPAPPPAAPPPAGPASTSSFAGGTPGSDPEMTVDRSSLPTAEGPVSGPVVIAVRCAQGHPSPPMAARCRVCGADLPPQDPAPVARPPLGVLRLSTGDLVSLDRGVLLGRSPRVPADVPPPERPHQLRVPSPDNDISRNHVEVVLDGWQVLVRDLGSTNGTMLTLPGTQPVQLRPHDLQVIEPGTVVTLSPEVSFVFEVGT